MTDRDDIEAIGNAIERRRHEWAYATIHGNGKAVSLAGRDYAEPVLAALRALGWQKVGPDQVVVPVPKTAHERVKRHMERAYEDSKDLPKHVRTEIHLRGTLQDLIFMLDREMIAAKDAK